MRLSLLKYNYHERLHEGLILGFRKEGTSEIVGCDNAIGQAMDIFDASNFNSTWTKGEFPGSNCVESVVTVSPSYTTSVVSGDQPSKMPDSGKHSGDQLSETPDPPDSRKKSHGKPSETPDSGKSISPISKYFVLSTSSTPMCIFVHVHSSCGQIFDLLK